MGEAREEGLVAAGGEVHTAIQQAVEDARVTRVVGGAGFLVVADRRRREEHADERERAGDLRGNAGVLERATQAVGQPRRGCLERVVGAGIELREYSETGGRREWIPRERAGLVHGAQRRELVHERGGSADGRERQ